MAEKNERQIENCQLSNLQDQMWTLEQVVEATRGRCVSGNGEVSFHSISTDSRTIEEGSLFVALSGENFNGENFAEDAVNNGACGLVMTRMPERDLSVPIVQVDDTLHALGDMASYRRCRMKNLQVIGITGSSGKTTVKEMTASILGLKNTILKTEGNFNNLIGLPLSLLPVNSNHRIAILEMGMNKPGEIARMTEIADPDIACINNVQKAHLQGLKDLQGVAEAKGELFAGVGSGAILVVNIDDKSVAEIAEKYSQKKVTFGCDARAMVRATDIIHRGEMGISFTLTIGEKATRVDMQCVGRHNVMNGLAAAAMANASGAGLDQISAGLGRFTPYDKRLQINKLQNGIRLVNDTYNANPDSMQAALETVKALRGEDRAVAVLGDMLELGIESDAAHAVIGKKVAMLDFDYLLTFGTLAEKVAASAIDNGMDQDRVTASQDKKEVVSCLLKLMSDKKIDAGDWLLFKGSRGVRMETIISDLLEAGV